MSVLQVPRHLDFEHQAALQQLHHGDLSAKKHPNVDHAPAVFTELEHAYAPTCLASASDIARCQTKVASHDLRRATT